MKRRPSLQRIWNRERGAGESRRIAIPWVEEYIQWAARTRPAGHHRGAGGAAHLPGVSAAVHDVARHRVPIQGKASTGWIPAVDRADSARVRWRRWASMRRRIAGILAVQISFDGRSEAAKALAGFQGEADGGIAREERDLAEVRGRVRVPCS